MQKAICPKCQSVISIDEKMTAFTCPNCQEQVFTDSAIKHLAKTINAYKRRGEIALLGSSDYPKAFTLYSSLAKIVPEDLTVLLSVTISKLYCTNLHEIHIKEATDLLLKGSDKVEIGEKNASVLGEYLMRIREDINKAIEAFKLHANKSNYALNLYHTALKQYIDYLKADLSIYEALSKYRSSFLENDKVINEEIKRVNDLLKEKITVKNASNDKHDFYNAKGEVIVDIYPNTKKLYKIRMYLYGVVGLGVILSIIGLILLSVKDMNPLATYLVLGIGLTFFIGGYFVGHHLRSKNYHLNY
ncbi:MAG: hypothetical protein MJ207_01810 [Bacilli bacterium]|nr:hypothetical protein [Bacilli bacterium]